VNDAAVTAAANPLRQAFSDGRPVIGTWSEIPHPFVAELLARAGFDFVAIDWQHGLHDFRDLLAVVHAVSSAGAVPIVRVPVNAEWAIQKALDAGAFGVIVPLVGSAAEAERAARACRYPPLGIRSYGPIRASSAITADPATVNREVLCIPMIETAAGIESIEAIARTDGVDALIVGPYDLSLSMQLPLGSDDVQPSVDRVLSAGRSAGIPVGRHFDTADRAPDGFAAGFAFIAIGTDREFVAASATAEATLARAGVRAARSPVDVTARPVATAAGA
jgi:4-hydroxy-2-oxoheptanedioate aldolase